VSRKPLVVAGTHGKTTSSSMLAWVLPPGGQDPGYLIGGAPPDLGSNATLGTGPWFVVEGDEYDSAYFDKEAKFLHYRPWAVLLNAIEFDHADIYRDVDHIEARASGSCSRSSRPTRRSSPAVTSRTCST
jgi:UDP-N-acetylmuramate: L-alanyl-gamma-D-glutamyl-meso-diaminopimelate ligase